MLLFPAPVPRSPAILPATGEIVVLAGPSCEAADGFADFLAGQPSPSGCSLVVRPTLLGAMAPGREPAFFPEAAALAAAFRAVLPPDATISLVLWTPPYAELPGIGAGDDAGGPARRFLAQDQGWPDLVSAALEGLRPRRAVVVAGPVSPAALYHAVTGHPAGEGLAPEGRVVSPLPSARAMLARIAAQGIRLSGGQRDRLVAFHAALPQHAAPLVADGLLGADLAGRYVADLALLRAMPGVTVLGGTPDGQSAALRRTAGRGPLAAE